MAAHTIRNDPNALIRQRKHRVFVNGPHVPAMGGGPSVDAGVGKTRAVRIAPRSEPAARGPEVEPRTGWGWILLGLVFGAAGVALIVYALWFR